MCTLPLERKRKAAEAGKGSPKGGGQAPGKGGAEAGKGKAKGDGKDKGRPKGGKDSDARKPPGRARACRDPARASAAGQQHAAFPTNCVALDSWANVWLTHEKDQPSDHFQDELHLAHGTCPCHRGTTEHGVPSVQVPWSESDDNIDLFPEGFLWERGCQILRGSKS